ncbi:PglY protein [Pseudonocardiaceae bacterium YIM PH 21723]|nr:PglY protein [Pseudonocardiaceae bacterium YIM PH 21723]
MTEIYLRDVLALPESVHASDFKVALVDGFTETEARVNEYVVTEQLQEAFGKALSIVGKAVRDGSSHAAYLHGSFGAGKSHFLTVLHAVLNNEPIARRKPNLQPIIAEHDGWLGNKRFLMVPYHLVGAADIDSAVLGGYVRTIRKLHPDQPTPAVYRADYMLQDALRQRQFLADDVKFAEWLGTTAPATVHDVDDLEVIEEAHVSGWTTAELDRAFKAPAGDPLRNQLISTLLSGPMSSYIRGASGDAEAFIPLENGLSVISRHARDLGYDGLILFLDELILWLQAHMSNQDFLNNQVSKLVKLIESGDADRVLPIVSFISRQRDLSKLVGEDVTGADVKNLEAQVQYLAERFDYVPLEDRNLPAIIKERMLRPLPGKESELQQAFAELESAKAADREVLLDTAGATGSTWQDFRDVYPLSPALLNVLVALSGALQRERTGLKLLQQMLYRRRADMKLGELIPLGDLWDVLAEGSTSEAFTDRLREEAASAQRFYTRVRTYLLDKYGAENSREFIAVDRFVKTLMLSALAPNVPALTRLTGARLAALNHGSLQTRTITPGAMAVRHLRDLLAEFGELRAEGDEDPVFTLQLSDLPIEPLLDAVGEQDSVGARRIWVKRQLWTQLGIGNPADFVGEREIVWKGSRRTAEFVFGNVREHDDLPDQQFEPSLAGRIRFVLDYPFDRDHSPAYDVARVHSLQRSGATSPTLVWLPHFFSAQKSAQLGRLLKIQYLLERDRLADYAGTMSEDNRIKVRHQLQAQRDNLESQLSAALRQLYGISSPEDSVVGENVGEEGHVFSLQPGYRPRLLGGATFEFNALALADGLFDSLYPKHPNFDPTGSRKPVTGGELRTVLGWLARAMEDGQRRTVVDKATLPLVRRIVHPLELGEVSDGPLNVSIEWRRRIEQCATQNGLTGDFRVEDITAWIQELGYTGLDRPVMGLLISCYAMLSDRAWVLHGSLLPEPPDLDRIGPGHALRAQQLPEQDAFTEARGRAAALFGVQVPDVLGARNVNRLYSEVKDHVDRLESPVVTLLRVLNSRAEALGVLSESSRLITAHRAADLVARLVEAQDAAALVSQLTGADRGDDQILGAAIKSAPAVLSALQGLEWSLLESARGFAGRSDVVGTGADRLLTDIAEAAGENELIRPLAPVLLGVQQRAVELVSLAAQSVQRDRVQPDPVVPEPAGNAARTAATKPQPQWHTKRVSVSGFESALAELLADVRKVTGDPAVKVDISWTIVGEDS